MRGHADLNEARTDGLASLGVFFVAHVGGLLVGRAFARDRELDVIDVLVPLDRGVGLPYINAVIAHQGFTANRSIGIVGGLRAAEHRDSKCCKGLRRSFKSQ